MVARLLIRSLILCSLLAAAGSAAEAATYYVAVTGSDENRGTASEPFATVQRAVAFVRPGDLVLVRRGTHVGFEITVSGLEGAPITIRAEPGALFTTPGPSNDKGDIVMVRNASHVVLEGLEVSGAPHAGISVQGEPGALATGVVLRGVKVRDNELYGVFTSYTLGLVVEDSTISGSRLKDGLAISRLADGTTVRRSTFHGNAAAGVLVSSDGESSVGGTIRGLRIEGNAIYDNGSVGAAAINLSAVTFSVIANNLLYDNHGTGIALTNDGRDANNGSFDNLIANNTVVQAADGRFPLSLKYGSARNRVVNNVLLHPGPRGSIEVDKSSAVDLYSDHNAHTGRIWFNGKRVTLKKWMNKLGHDASSIETAPGEIFVDAAQRNFRLKADGPAVDRGIPVPEVGVDLLGMPRQFGAGVDIGAYEFQGVN